MFGGFPPFTYEIPAVHGTVDYGTAEPSLKDEGLAMVDYEIAKYEEADRGAMDPEQNETTQPSPRLHMAGYTCSQRARRVAVRAASARSATLSAQAMGNSP